MQLIACGKTPYTSVLSFNKETRIPRDDIMQDTSTRSCLKDLSQAVLLLADTDSETGKILIEMCSKVRMEIVVGAYLYLYCQTTALLLKDDHNT
jgi:hypothetical protein